MRKRGNTRGRKVLLAQADRNAPIGAPPEHLTAAQAQAWRDIVAAAPAALRRPDEIALELAARSLAAWRAGDRTNDLRKSIYRWLGDFFVPMAARRRLLK